MADPDAPGFKPLDRAAAARHDHHFADDFVTITGAAMPISRTLATRLGYEVERPEYTAGDDARGQGGDD